MTVHRRELKRQTVNTFDKFGVEGAEIETIQTLTNKEFTPPSVLIVDECHLSMAKTWKSVIQKCIDAGTYVIGLTATPCRLDGQPLGELYNDIVYAKDMKWLIKNKYLSTYKYMAPHIPNMQSAKKSMGDYSKASITEIMDGKVLSDAIGHYRNECNGKRIIAFCASIEHSKHLVEVAHKQGVNANHLDGTMGDKERQAAIKSFAALGGILSNVNICTEGFDLAAQIDSDITVEGVILLRPTQSLALHRQMVGRALRKKYYPAIILDMAGNYERHGFPDDMVSWSLKGKNKRDSDTLSIQRCPDCFHIQKPSPVCSMCGHVFKADGKVIEEIDGCLYAIDSETWHDARRKELANAKTYKDFAVIGSKRGWKEKDIYAEYRKHGGESLKQSIDGWEEIADAHGHSRQWASIKYNYVRSRR